ncbi:UvrD-helicase domain-containing protein [Rossellomorea aquimaris]|uniref:ATP-dependent helicase n=1 Tax=Rossellomorea aquimaris TaxID=189382 RepID=A0A5D4THP4_9BACI|nr:UvrD-helicase domain-containing protein [Rossellomorea aquimaris]TYS75320.1 ATP-dependent helicase [Rossellomorea aquimaris]
MAKGLNIDHQFTLVNSPAGSGKTTAVSNSIKDLLKDTDKKILCITYTNRAAEQLREKIDNELVNIGTIHSFIGNFMSSFFKLKPIVDYFIEFYEDEILKLLGSKDEKDLERLKKFKERNSLEEESIVTKQVLSDNIEHLEYGETQFTSFLYGRLSHDDLLVFSKSAFDKFPKLSASISHQYSYIFIDEYQDTRSEVLELFYNICFGKRTKLVLLGDEMQQIYSDRVEAFQEVIEQNFKRDLSLKNNWRSQGKIVSVLNNIYYDSSYKQIPQVVAEGQPLINIVKDLGNIECDRESLQLVLYNSELFKSIEAYSLYLAYSERYKHYDKHSAKEILLNMTMENPDDLMILMIFITEIIDLYDNQQFALLIQKIMDFKYANKNIWKINNHKDKIKVANQLKEMSSEIKNDITIQDLLKFMQKNKIIDSDYIDEIINNIKDDIDFEGKICSVKFREFQNCYKEIQNPTFSTQHAVKGEGHDWISLKISDGNNPNVKMYFFLELFSKGLFNYETLTNISREAKSHINSFTKTTGRKTSGLKASEYKLIEGQCKFLISNLKISMMSDKNIFDGYLFLDFTNFEKKPNVTNFNKCIRLVNKIHGVLLAYKLFYVGCSRAKRKLDVYVKGSEIYDFREEFISTIKKIGFEVNNPQSKEV